MSSEGIRVTHVGSLVRPDDFAALLRRRMAGQSDDREYLPALRNAVHKVVADQVAAGVDIVSDGEYGKGIGWEQYVLERLAGFGPALQLATEGGVSFGDFARFKDFYAELWPKEGYLEGVYPCVGAIKYTGHAALQRDIDNLKSAMKPPERRPVFCPSPRRQARSRCRRTTTTRATRSTCSRALRRCARSIARSRRPASMCRSTTRTCRSCTTAWCRPRSPPISASGRACASTR